MIRAIILFILLLPMTSINVAATDDDMTSDLICPCECAMIISTCDCSTAIQVKKEISSMKESGFSEKQVVSALQAEYGREILVRPEKADSTSLWVAGTFLAVILSFLGYIMTRKLKPGIIPDKKEYEKRFEEEYQEFVSELEEM